MNPAPARPSAADLARADSLDRIADAREATANEILRRRHFPLGIPNPFGHPPQPSPGLAERDAASWRASAAEYRADAARLRRGEAP